MTPESADRDESALSPSDLLLRDVAYAPDRPLPSSDGEGRIGTSFGRFRILELLGRGGVGVVYAARDERLSRVVALKLLLAAGSLDDERKRRLTREARAASAISHPGIATVFDVGEVDGQVFIAMERVTGRTLRAILAEGPLPVPEALRVGAALARALGAAHAVGIVHRDLKPDNVMITGEGSVKILDFGLAKPLDGARAGEVEGAPEQLTLEGRILGTPSYMSPEQASGLSVDARSDVFSLGVVLYEMLTGARPFSGRTAMQTMMSVTRDRPRALSRRRGSIPARVARIVERCLEKQPDRRPQDAISLAADLEGALAAPAGRRRLFLVAALALAAAAPLGWVAWSRSPRVALASAPPGPEPHADPAPLAARSTADAPPVESTPTPALEGSSQPRRADEARADGASDVAPPEAAGSAARPASNVTQPGRSTQRPSRAPSSSGRGAPPSPAPAIPRAPRDPLAVQK